MNAIDIKNAGQYLVKVNNVFGNKFYNYHKLIIGMNIDEIKAANSDLAKSKRDSRKLKQDIWLQEDIPRIIENREKSAERMKKSRDNAKSSVNKNINICENDKNNFYNNYEKQTNFNSCAVCAFESGLQDMVEITDIVRDYFISSGIQGLYQERLAEYKITRDQSFVESLESETNEYGVLKYCKYICTKCYNTINQSIAANRRRSTNISRENNVDYSILERAKFGRLCLIEKLILKKYENERNVIDLKFLSDNSEAIAIFKRSSEIENNKLAKNNNK